MADELFTLEQVGNDPEHDYVLASRRNGVPMYRRVEADNNVIYHAELEEWLGVMSQLWTAYGKPIDTEQMVIYQKSLSGVPMGLLEKSILRTIRHHSFNNVPTVAEVWLSIRAELKNPYDIDQAIQAWMEDEYRKVVYKFEPEPVEAEG